MYLNQLEAVYSIAKKYGVDESVIKNRLIKNGVKIAKGSPYSKNYWIERGLSESEAEYKIKVIKPSFIEYWLDKGFNLEESQLRIEAQRLSTLRGYIFKYGQEEGNKLWLIKQQEHKNGLHSKRCLPYWLNKGYTEKEAKIEISKIQSTFSLKICIEKYGPEQGLIKFNERQLKWQKSLYKNGKLKSGYSEVSQELFFKIIESIEINDLNYFIFAKKGGEFVLNSNNGFYRYDFTDLKNKRIIEYNGDDYHGNPNKYRANDFPNPFKKNVTAQELWDKDELKRKLAEQNGFEVLVIWDSDYKRNKNLVIDKCKEFLKINK